MISKRLLGEVLGKKVDTHTIRFSSLYCKFDNESEYNINIHKLVHKVKTWCLDNLEYPSIDIHYNINFKMITVTHFIEGELLKEVLNKDEDEWLFLGEWILENMEEE